MMNISKKKILKTTLLPGIIPRIRNLFGSGFGKLAYLVALVYNMVRILPNNHPYLKRENIGKYSTRQVVAVAADNIVFSRKNIDQIIIFFTVISALFILVIQFIILISTILISSAKASPIMPSTIEGFFQTPNPSEDIAYRLLDLVFGVPDFFGSKEVVGTALHQALQGLFQFYSFGMILVGCVIIVYYIIAVAVETAQSGTPFGQRFSHPWAPIRLILFFALLVPISYGLNGAQYIALTAAKLGSGMASTGWITFNATLTAANETLTGRLDQNLATPNPTDLTSVPAFMLIAKTCQVGYLVNHANGYYMDSWDPNGAETGIRAWAVYQQLESNGGGYNSVLMSSNTFQDLSAISGSSTIQIVFGVKDPSTYASRAGFVEPLCGSIGLRITDLSEPGTALIHTAYYNLILRFWNDDPDMQTYAENYTKRYLNIRDYTDPEALLPSEEYKQNLLNELLADNITLIDDAIQAQLSGEVAGVPQDVLDYGWAGAGIWYNDIAQKNGALVTALHLTPIPIKYPRVMERAKSIGLMENKQPNYADRFSINNKQGSAPFTERLFNETEILLALNQAYAFWEGNREQEERRTTKNPIIDTINVILGTEALFEICKNTDTHPMAQLATVGKSMVNRSISAFAAAGMFTVASIIPTPLTGATTAAASFFGTIGMVGLLVGAILFYLLPFLPFLYFFFAVGGWVKGLFEAMVAMPLWALAHLRIDGDGIPGEAAISGYYLIFEIFLRPILIVFGLLASITIFSAMIRVLNDVFYLAVSNMSGHDPASNTVCFQTPSQYSTNTNLAQQSNDLRQAYRGPIDEFFFTILYTIIVYMVGTTSFKLIDMIPNDILRWFNAETSSFNDDRGDAGSGLVKFFTLAGGQFGGQISDSIKGVGGGLRGSAHQIFK